MADYQSGVTPVGLPIARACDNCRSRKIRCDKASPCSNCRTAKMACHTSERPAKEQKQRVLITSQYEQKIDSLERRLAGIEQLLQQLVANQQYAPEELNVTGMSRPPYSDESRNPMTAPEPRQRAEQSEQGNHFEGETSLSAHSKQAHRTLESLLGRNPRIKNDPDVAAALSDLHSMMQKQVAPGHPTKRYNARKARSARKWEDEPLPPRSVVNDLIEKVRESHSETYLAWFMHFDIDEFAEDYSRLCDCPEEASVPLKVNVNGGLFYLFSGHPLIMEHSFDQVDSSGVPYLVHAQRCRTNLEEYIWCFPMLIPPTLETISALATAASHAIQIAEFSLCWTLTCAAARSCQSLGWHRAHVIRQQTDTVRRTMKGVFWTVYFIDKCLSLRLGVSPTFQDFDMAVDIQDIPFEANSPAKAWNAYLKLAIELANLHGLIYEKLYSPGALRSGLEHRTTVVQELSRRIKQNMAENTRILQSTEFSRTYLTMMGDSTEVILNCLLTLVYRKMIIQHHDSNQSLALNSHCLEAARAAMACHQRAIRTLSAESTDMWSEYFNWTVLNCPFTPFMVIFCNVVSTLDRDDLELLKDFVTSIAGPAHGSSDAIIRFYQLCSGFYRLAESYMAAITKEDIPSEGPALVVPLKRSAASMLDGGDQASNARESHAGAEVTAAADPVLYDPNENWLLSGSFEDWFLGDPQSLDRIAGDWPAFGAL